MVVTNTTKRTIGLTSSGAVLLLRPGKNTVNKALWARFPDEYVDEFSDKGLTFSLPPPKKTAKKKSTRKKKVNGS